MGLLVNGITLGNGLVVANTYISLNNTICKVESFKIPPEQRRVEKSNAPPGWKANCSFQVQTTYCMYANQQARIDGKDPIFRDTTMRELTATEFEAKNCYGHIYDSLKETYPSATDVL